MIDQYVLATNDDGDLAIRTVSATESSSVTDTTSVITATDDGKLAVRVVGAGGDQHNLGYYADLTALQTAYPTGTDGDFAILGSTDTIWVWDSGTSAWKDTDTKGQVTSVNNQTGAVTLGINDVAPTQTGKSGYVLGTDGFVAGWVKPEIVQVSALPAASEDEVDNIYQFVGTTDANYTNGYFYKCVSDGQDPATYSWTQTDVQPQAGGLPSQTGHSGEFLTTDGTDASWATINALQNTATGNVSLTIAGTPSSVVGATNVGVSSNVTGMTGTAVGYQAVATGVGSIQLGTGTNSNDGTFCVATTKNYLTTNRMLLDADGNIPSDRLPNAINKYSTMPTAASTNMGWIVQFTGATDSTYTHGYIYECKAQGTTPETYAWEAVTVQAGGGGGLPDQTGNTGKFLTTDGTDASWATVNSLPSQTGQSGKFLTTNGTSASWGDALVNNAVAAPSLAIYGSATGSGRWSISLGTNSSVTQPNCTAVGVETSCSATNSLALGAYAKTTAAYAKQLGPGTNSEDGTFCVGSRYNNTNVNYKMMDADGTIPTDRFTTTPSADGTYVPTLTISSGVATRTWAAPSGGGSTALSLALAAANWSNNTITVTATGVTASNNVIVSPAPASQSAYTTAGVMCTAQASDSLTFTCTTTPSSDLTVTVLII